MLIVLFSSCKEEFLERKPTSQIEKDDFFITNSQSLVLAVNACYKAIGINFWGGGWHPSTFLLIPENTTDNAYDSHDNNGLYYIGIGTGNAYSGYVRVYWRKRYIGIQRTNNAIEGAKNVSKINDDFRARLVAEAKFLRAYFYFELVYLFGDVPYITKLISPQETIKIGRTDKSVILDSLVSDLTEAEKALPNNYPSSDIGRATKGAALALKSRILLYQEKWAEAAVAAKEVMDLGVYSLYPNYGRLFSYDGVNSSEVIFDLQEQRNRFANFSTVNFGPQSIGGWSSSTPLQSLVDAYECTDGNSIKNSPLYDSANPYENRDPRLTQTILYPGRDWINDGVYNTIPGATYAGKDIIRGDDLTDGHGSIWNKTNTGYNWLKYISVDDYKSGNVWNGAIHLILIRYADVLLMYAEGKIEANDIDQSVADAINKVRTRAKMPNISISSQEDMRKILRNERRVELAFENLRLLDIRRWRIAEEVMSGVPKMLYYTNSSGEKVPIRQLPNRKFDINKDYLWPIPQAEVDASKIEQNPGW